MKIIDFWKPREVNTGAQLQERSLIVMFCYANIIISAAYILTNMRLGITLWINHVQILGSLITLLFLKFFASHRPGAHVFLAQAAFNIAGLVALFHNFPYTIILWIPVYAVGSVYLLGVKLGGVWTLVCATLVAGSLQFGSELLTSSIAVNPEDYTSIAIVSMLLVGAAAFAASLLFAHSIKKLSASIEAQNEELKAQNATIARFAQDKSLLVSIVCHDIANPLMLASHYSEKVIQNPAEAATYMPKVRNGLKSIEAITKGVRELQAIDSGKLTVKAEPVDLRAIFEASQITFARRLAEKNLTLELEIQEGHGTWVMADETSLTHSVVNNLISNAIKFSADDHKIIVSVTEEPDFIVLRVKDFGVGMPSDLVTRIFDQHHPTTATGTRGERGTGFGLPITKAIMDRLGGKIEVQSKDVRQFPDDHGTTFVLRFQKAPARNAA